MNEKEKMEAILKERERETKERASQHGPLPTPVEEEMIKAEAKKGPWKTRHKIIKQKCPTCGWWSDTYLIRSSEELTARVSIECRNPRCWRIREQAPRVVKFKARKTDMELLETYGLTVEDAYLYTLILLRKALISPDEVKDKDTDYLVEMKPYNELKEGE